MDLPKKEVIGHLYKSYSSAVDEYTASKVTTSVAIKAPNWDSAEDSIELLWFHNRRELEAMHVQQQETMENINNQVAIDKSRIRKMHKDHTELRRQFIATNFFFKECEEKRKLAEKKIEEQMATQTELNRGIDETKKAIVDLTEFRGVLKRVVRDMKPYERVLREVVHVAPDFKTIDGCILVGDSLMIAQVDIQQLQTEKLMEIMEMNNRMKDITKEAGLQVLGLKNNLSELERSYANASNECMRWEAILGRGRAILDENIINKERVLDGLYHLYALVCNRTDIVGRHGRESVELLLDTIKDETDLMREVVDACHGIRKKEKGHDIRCL